MQAKSSFESDSDASFAAEQNEQRSLVDEGKRLAEESLKDAGKIYSETINQVSDLVRKHPLEALMIGFGVGCLVGLALTRRNS